MKLYIRNMVCSRCKMVVQDILEKIDIHPIAIDLGEVELAAPPTAAQLKQLDNSLRHVGFELIDDKKSRLIEQIKTILVKWVHDDLADFSVRLSDFIAQQVHYDYNYLSNLFSEVEGTTIEQYFIALKIERAKELLVYDELSLSAIASQLGYSSTAYLSAQFKKVTGLTPTFYKSLKEHKRRNIEDL